MLNQKPRDNSRAPAPIEPIITVVRIAPEGVVLGAGTVLLPADGPRQLRSTKGCEARVLALLSAAYDRAVDPAVLGNIDRAAKAWNAGDDCLAYIHLAHARLGELQYPHDAVQRLIIVDAFLKAGGSPRTVFKGLKLDASYISALDKEYNPAEPRVPPTIAFDLAAIAPDLVKQNEPKLCPEPPVRDKEGSDQGKEYAENPSRQYEDYIKKFINDPPTPSGYVYMLPRPKGDGEPVRYDDCQRKAGILFEIKGEQYASLLQMPQAKESITKEWLAQAYRQVEASEGRPIVWIFAEPEAAKYAQELFADPKYPELRRIVIMDKRWERERQ